MEALILSCSTGGGHNAAGKAVKEELERRGHKAVMLDPYSLVGQKLADKIGNAYVKMAQKYSRIFGQIYRAGELYRRLPVHSPVYSINLTMVDKMKEYLDEHPCDVIVMPHIFPAEIITCMKAKGVDIPKTVFIATDYTCIPFTEETDCDYYVIPSEKLTDVFTCRGIPKDKIRPFGIPVQQVFCQDITRQTARERLELSQDRRYILVAGGSIGGGEIWRTVKHLKDYLKEHPDCTLIVICGSNKSLYQKLQKHYGDHPQIILLQHTDCMAEYMKASDLLITKPGGLTSTEAAVSRMPIIHTSPIPGCEVWNAQFFSDEGLSFYVKDQKRLLIFAVELLREAHAVAQMLQAQKDRIDPRAAEHICDLLEGVALGNA